MAAFYAPFLWIKVVGTITKIVCKTYSMSTIGKGYNTFGSNCRKHNSFVAKIFYRCFVVNFYIWITASVAIYSECQTMVGYYFLAFNGVLLYSMYMTLSFLLASATSFSAFGSTFVLVPPFFIIAINKPSPCVKPGINR